jgi:ABC-type Zn uptake system ZnuABC Zn-binding protein ZnuA
MAKITKRDVLTKAMGMDFTEDEIEVIKGMIAGLDKRSAKPTKAQVANEAVKAEIRKVLTAEPKTAKAIAEAVGESTNKVAALLKQIEGVVVTEGKGKNPKTYSIAE